MRQPSDYATAPAQMGGEFEKLPVGGHVCKILNAKVEQSRSGLDMLVLAIEIADGTPLDGYYKRAYERAKAYRVDAKFPGVYRSTVTKQDGTTNPMFKGLMTAIEKSNPGYTWNWNEATLAGKFVGFNFGEEEFLTQQGEVRTNVKPRFPASVEDVRKGDMIPPAIKKLAGTERHAGVEFVPAPTDDDLPFD